MPIEDDRFLGTADESAQEFGGGTHDSPQGFLWDEGIVDRDVLALRQKAIYLKSVAPVEHLILSEEEIGYED